MESKLNDFVQAQLEDDSNLTGDQRAALFHFTQVQYGERLTLAENQKEALQAFWMNEKKEFLPIAKHLKRILNPVYSPPPYFVDKVTATQAKWSNQQLIFYLNQEILIETVSSYQSISIYARAVAADLFRLGNAMDGDEGGKADQASILVMAEGMRDAAELLNLLETDCAIRSDEIYRIIEGLHASHYDRRPYTSST